MEQRIIVAIVLGVLVLVSAVQAVQLYTLKDKVVSSGLKASSASASQPTASAGGRQIASVPSSVNDLPQMVGGC